MYAVENLFSKTSYCAVDDKNLYIYLTLDTSKTKILTLF